MKRKFVNLVAIGLCVNLLAGCGAAKQTESGTSMSETSDSEDASGAAKVEEKVNNIFAGESVQKYQYMDPMYNVSKNQKLVFTDLSDTAIGDSLETYVQVFYDNNFEDAVECSYDVDYDDRTLTIEPLMAYSYEEEQSSSVTDGTWGTRSKFFIVQYKDFNSGEYLDMPQVTVFTTEEALNTPTLKQSVGQDGFYKLEWSAVDNADYYEVYEITGTASDSFSVLEYTTEDTTASGQNFNSTIEHEKRFNETYKDTEIDVDRVFSMNVDLEEDGGYFVVAKTNDGQKSGMSNTCFVQDIANQIPCRMSDDFQTEYSGSGALDLPAYADVEMLDGSDGKFLIDYHGATVSELEDGRIAVKASFRHLVFELDYIYMTGVDFDDLMDQAEKLTKREDNLDTVSDTPKENLEIPYLPDQDNRDLDETADDTKDDTKEKAAVNDDLNEKLQKTIYANTGLGAYLAEEMLSHNEEISLDGYNEISDSEYFNGILMEAYKQNPLIGTVNNVSYDYDNNSLVVSYAQSKDDNIMMQEASLDKVEEITSQIITDDMDDFEKEEAINDYLCENASYNEDIMDYIDEDGTISQEALSAIGNSFIPYGILVENSGVCESYAESFLLLAQNAGLDAVITTGKLGNVGHEWNRVKLDDQWYTLDVTNNDNEFQNCFFNLPDDLASVELKEDGDCYMSDMKWEFTALGMEFEYYTKKGMYQTSAKEAAGEFIQAFDQDSMKTAGVRIDDESMIEDIVTNVANNSTNAKQIKYYYVNGVLSIIVNSSKKLH